MANARRRDDRRARTPEPSGGRSRRRPCGVRPVEQGEGESFVLAFARGSDAVECALELQTAPLAPIRLRIGIHTGQIQLRDEGNYAGPTINRTARLRDLAHGGQSVMSAATEQLVVDWLPADAWLTDWAPISCATSLAPSAWRSCAIPTCATSPRRCGRPKVLTIIIFRSNSPVSSAVARRWTRCDHCWPTTGW